MSILLACLLRKHAEKFYLSVRGEWQLGIRTSLICIRFSFYFEFCEHQSYIFVVTCLAKRSPVEIDQLWQGTMDWHGDRYKGLKPSFPDYTMVPILIGPHVTCYLIRRSKQFSCHDINGMSLGLLIASYNHGNREEVLCRCW